MGKGAGGVSFLDGAHCDTVVSVVRVWPNAKGEVEPDYSLGKELLRLVTTCQV